MVNEKKEMIINIHIQILTLQAKRTLLFEIHMCALL
jgi:hypothetical protein